MSNSKQTPKDQTPQQPQQSEQSQEQLTQPNLLPIINGNARIALQKAWQRLLPLIGDKNANSELGFAAQIIAKSAELKGCPVKSIEDSVVNAARVGLTLNPSLRLGSIFARGGKAVYEIGYMGYIVLLKRGGGVKYIDAYIHYEDEDFKFEPTTGSLHHVPEYVVTEEEQKARKILGCYSRAVLLTGDVVFNYMPIWEINKRRAFSEGHEEKGSAWTQWEEDMVKKTAIRRHFKLLISDSTNEQLREAVRIEDESNTMNFPSAQRPSLLDFDFDDDDNA